MKRKHADGMMIFGIIFSILPLPFYIGTILSGNIAYLAIGIVIQISGAILFSVGRGISAKLKNAPSS